MKNNYILKHDTHMTSKKTVNFSRLPTPLVYVRPKIFHSPNFVRLISNKPPSSNDNQSIKRKHIIQVGFDFQYKLINIIWISFDFFLLSLTTCFFVAWYSCVCSCPKNIPKCLLFIIIHICSIHFVNNQFYLSYLKT